MSEISSWSSTAASNNSASPNGFPEGMAPGGVNDSAREVMASVRLFAEDAQWFDWGNTPTFVSSASFTVSGDLTARYAQNRRIKCYGTSMGTLYGRISSSSYSAPNTTVNVTLDSGSLTSNLSRVYLSIITPANNALPHNLAKTDAQNSYSVKQVISSSVPQWVFVETDAAADNQRWDITVNSEQWAARAVNDADNSATSFITVERTGLTVDSVEFGGTLVSLTNGRLKFPSTQSPSADVNTLDDYEEGTFSPVLKFGGATTGITYSVQAGAYTKIGNRVFINIHIGLTSKGSATGDATVTDLPFTIGAASAISWAIRFRLVSYTGMLQCYSDGATTQINLQQIVEAGTTSNITDANISNTSSLLISGHYSV